MQNNIVSVLTEAQQKELKEYDAIFGDGVRELGSQIAMGCDIAKDFEQALLKAVEAFGDTPQEPRLIVVSRDLISKLELEALYRDKFLKASRRNIINELSSLVPEKTCGYNTGRKGKGERKRASRQQRKQWR